MTTWGWLYLVGLLLALALVTARGFSRSRRAKPIEIAADCAALSFLMAFAKNFGWTWLALVGAALGVGSVIAMIYFYFRKPPAH